MALSNAEKQAAWRARQAENKRRVAKLEAEVERLKARVAELEVGHPAASKVRDPRGDCSAVPVDVHA